MPALLPETITLRELVADGRLSNPPRYLRLAFAHLLQAGAYGAVSLRIGRTGTGVWPHYVLERGGEIAGRFDGQSHWAWEDDAHHKENWSATAMTAVDLHALWLQETASA